MPEGSSFAQTLGNIGKQLASGPVGTGAMVGGPVGAAYSLMFGDDRKNWLERLITGGLKGVGAGAAGGGLYGVGKLTGKGEANRAAREKLRETSPNRGLLLDQMLRKTSSHHKLAEKVKRDRHNAFQIGVDGFIRDLSDRSPKLANHVRQAVEEYMSGKPVTKLALDWKDLGRRAIDWAKENPRLAGMGAGALGGAALGGLTGKNSLRRALLGGLLGGGLGYGGGYAYENQMFPGQENDLYEHLKSVGIPGFDWTQ